jgi:hypothetical protein
MNALLIFLVFFALGLWISISSFGMVLDFLVEKGSRRGVRRGPWKTHLGVGRKHTPYIEKAAIARIGLGANDSDETIYWNAFTDDDGQELRAEHDYRIVFRSKPPVRYQDKGFWSITVYGSDKFLVPNPDKKYMIHSDTDFELGEDSQFAILLARNNTVHDTNWLPLPEAGGKFSIAFRCYVPEQVMKTNIMHVDMPSIIRI